MPRSLAIKLTRAPASAPLVAGDAAALLRPSPHLHSMRHGAGLRMGLAPLLPEPLRDSGKLR